MKHTTHGKGHMNRTRQWMKLCSRTELTTNMQLVVYLCEMMMRMMSFNNMDEFGVPKMKFTTRLQHMDEIDDTNELL